jgi:hypothetical protein
MNGWDNLKTIDSGSLHLNDDCPFLQTTNYENGLLN